MRFPNILRHVHATNSTRPDPRDGVLCVPTSENVRDLGGIPVPGGSTLTRRFVRSASLSELSEEDVDYLVGYGITLDLDLRSPEEVMRSPDVLGRHRAIRYLNVPALDLNLHDPDLKAAQTGDEELSYFARGYLRILANQDAVRRIFTFFATARPTDCVIFHCAAGMDRTGIVSMLLLALAGADEDHVAADYAYSFFPHEVADAAIFGDTPPQDFDPLLVDVIRSVFRILLKRYGSCSAYLSACGLATTQIEAVRGHLTG
ncbi:tyrosine-protein phosphatase [Olsenella uli]|uniref:tyrosine-protein phosphatase n=1 Tax=Olsenella uli TaxID=133926 RepID=UPI00044E0879|nr:tyrosine-protein phosphatase [Olsenella uli]EUB31309.1 tyrosine phosphatase family protein [Olsenella uli MSTE5]